MKTSGLPWPPVVSPGPKFKLGTVAMGAKASTCLTAIDIVNALGRHMNGDWGELDAEDKAANDAALEQGARLLSAYSAQAPGSLNKIKFWVVTEADRSNTTILLPEEY